MKGGTLSFLLALFAFAALGQSNLDVVSQNILYINQEYAKYNPYNTMFRIVKSNNQLVWYNEYGERKGDLGDLEFRVTTEKYLGVYCIDGDECITDGDGDALKSYDMTYKDDNDNFPSSGYLIPEKFNEIKTALGIAVRSSGSTNGAYSGTGTSIDFSKIRENLAYVNSKFATYNDYNTSFELNTTTGELKVKDKFGYLALHISKVEFYLDYTNNMFRVRSMAGREELQHFSTTGSRSDKEYWSYGMGLNYNDKLISDAPTVVAKLEEIREMYSVGSSAYVSTALAYINSMFDSYNDYGAHYDAEQSSKMMVFSNEFGLYKSDASQTEYRIEGNNFGVYCKTNSDCMLKYDDYGNRTYGSETNNYTMGLRYDDSVIVEGIAVAEILTSIAEVVANGGSATGVSKTYYGNSVQDRLNKINDIFKEHSSNGNVWTVNESTKQLIGTTSGCAVTINLNELDNIEYYLRNGTDFGFRFVSDSKGILEKCTSFENYVDKSYEYLDSELNARTVISEMLAIKELVLQ